jgi:hypothetical protein
MGVRRVHSSPSVQQHISPEEVEEVLAGLAGNMVVALPSTCCQDLGLDPNISDKQRPKEMVRSSTPFQSRTR